MDVMSFIVGFISAFAVLGLGVFVLGAVQYAKQNKSKGLDK